MKLTAKTIQSSPTYTPIELSIVLETEEDLAKIFALFDHTDVVNGFGIKEEARLLRDQIKIEVYEQTGSTKLTPKLWKKIRSWTELFMLHR